MAQEEGNSRNTLYATCALVLDCCLHILSNLRIDLSILSLASDTTLDTLYSELFRPFLGLNPNRQNLGLKQLELYAIPLTCYRHFVSSHLCDRGLKFSLNTIIQMALAFPRLLGTNRRDPHDESDKSLLAATSGPHAH